MCYKWIIENHNWNLTIFSDEKRFNLDGPDNWKSYMMPGQFEKRDNAEVAGLWFG